jgi:hypothetical protein
LLPDTITNLVHRTWVASFEDYDRTNMMGQSNFTLHI